MSDLRRLPVFLLIDCSESMAGPAFQAVHDGLVAMLTELKSDPHALETVWLSLITFSSRARVAVPLTDICRFELPRLVLGSGTALGVALDLLRQRMALEVTPQTAERKGDWKPLVFLMTDGDPTDTWFGAADRFRNEIAGPKANVVAIACGPCVNISNLKRVTPNVVVFKNAREPSFKEFFRWITQSMRAGSLRAASGRGDTGELPALPPSMEMAVEGLQLPSQDHVFLLARCHRTRGLYVSRFERLPEDVLEELRTRRGLDLPRDRALYAGSGSHPIVDFDWEGSQDTHTLSISSGSLIAPPACPHCQSQSWAPCGQCQRVFCVAEEGPYTCPWCGDTRTYTIAKHAFEVGRTMG